MAIYFSPSSKSFYDNKIYYAEWPKDLIEITEEEHMRLLDGASRGKEIDYVNGKIVLVDRKVVITWDDITTKRARLLRESDYTQTLDWPGDKQAWAVYRQKLRDITADFENPEDVVWPTPPSSQ